MLAKLTLHMFLNIYSTMKKKYFFDLYLIVKWMKWMIAPKWFYCTFVAKNLSV